MSLTLEHQRNSFGGPYRDRSWAGLTLLDLCLQSHTCHPDWDADTIAMYAVTEEPFDPAVVHAAPIDDWLRIWRCPW